MTEFNYLRTVEDKPPAGCDAVLFTTGFMVMGANGRWEHHISYTDQDRSQMVRSQMVTFVNHRHSVIYLSTGPMPPPKRCLHIVRSRASSFKWEYHLLSLRTSSSFLRLLPRLLATSISPLIFPSITRFRRQFLRKMCPSQLAFRFLISCRIFLCSLTPTNLLHPPPAPHFETSQVFLICCPKRPSFSTI